jgi:STE24 endopeptidase
MDPQTLLYLIAGIVAAGFIFEQWLNYLNYTHMSTELPEELRGIYPEDEYRRSLSYQKERQRFSLVSGSISFLLIIILLLSGAFGWLDSWLREFTTHPIWLALAFFGLLALASELLSLPFQWYSTFVIEEKWGFNKTSPSTFIADKIKTWLLTMVLGGAALVGLLYLIMVLGQSFWIYFWVAMVIVSLLANILFTSLILPLFNKLSPLPGGELREAIEDYSTKINFPIENMYVIDGSKRSSKANAFFSGLGKKKKIVFYDTLIEKHETGELVAVLAHEAGHYKRKHLPRRLAMSVLQMGLMLFLLSQLVFSETLSLALGAETMALHLNLLGFGLLFSPVSMLLGIFMNKLSRKHEYEADAYAAQTYDAGALEEALKKLSVRNLSNLCPHPWYVKVYYSHPPLLKRLRALEAQESA